MSNSESILNSYTVLNHKALQTKPLGLKTDLATRDCPVHGLTFKYIRRGNREASTPGDTWVDEASAFMDHFFAQYYHRLKEAGWPTVSGCTALPEDHPWLNFYHPGPDHKKAHLAFEGGGLDRAYALLDAIDKTPFCATYSSDENGIQEFTASDCASDAPFLEADHWVMRIDPDTNVDYADVRNAFRTVFERLIQS